MQFVFHVTSHNVMTAFSCNTSVISYMVDNANGQWLPGIVRFPWAIYHAIFNSILFLYLFYFISYFILISYMVIEINDNANG